MLRIDTLRKPCSNCGKPVHPHYMARRCTACREAWSAGYEWARTDASFPQDAESAAVRLYPGAALSAVRRAFVNGVSCYWDAA